MKLNSPLPEWDFSSIFNLGLQYDWLKTCDEGFMELWYSTKGDINQKKLILYLIHNFLGRQGDRYCFINDRGVEINKRRGLRYEG